MENKAILVFIMLIYSGTCLCWVWGSNPNEDRILLADISTMNFSKTKMATRRRSDPVPQLSCVGGLNLRNNEVNLVYCKENGTITKNENLVKWVCKPDNPVPGYKIEPKLISCEGYDYPNDPYIMRDSCALEYALSPTYAKSSTQDYVIAVAVFVVHCATFVLDALRLIYLFSVLTVLGIIYGLGSGGVF